jgi:DNA-dependent protein kinase catalytic subunit
LTEIAKNYPQALYFPFRISTENLALSETAEQAIAPLRKLLANPLLDQFVASLEKLTHPEHRWKDWVEELKPLIKNKRRDARRIRELVQQIHKDVFDPKQPDIGTYNKRFAAEWEKEYIRAFGADGSILCRMKLPEFGKIIADFWAQMDKKLEPKKTQAMKLHDFSTWLAEFEQSDQSSPEYIELPGQYSGLCKPQPETHIKVSSFSPKLLVMGSMRRPKRLKIHGNDERDYPYLVKGGEDLRLDQRVEQLFSVMNEIFVQNPACCKRRLAIKTYQVVPMTSKVGIIEWLENTRPLKEIIEEEIARDSKKKVADCSIMKIQAAQIHNQWLQSYSSKANPKTLPGLYYAMFMHASREDTLKKVTKQHESLRWDLLKRGVQALAKSPEAYLAIRGQFARSLSVFSVASYIIGIGDRHLENFLLDHKTGGLIGIDFGHAFGSATQFLPIPELIPFRLTRQLTNFLLPLDSQGLLKHNMVHSLAALQENKDILLNTMDVFIKEPLMDWDKLARRLVREQCDEETDPRSWFPKEKIDIARKKLDGYNCAHITIEELNGSVHAHAAYMPHLRQIVAGLPGANVRARVGKKCASVKQQVDCLVDQATDPNVLGRTYGGWAAWI